MKIRINSSDLLKSLKLHSKSVTKPTPIPITACIVINSRKEMASCNLEVFVTTKLKGEILDANGTPITINYKIFKDCISKMGKNKQITLDNNDIAWICISDESGKIIRQLPASKYDDFPAEPPMESEKVRFSINKDLLVEGIRNTESFCSEDETRYVLNGVFIESAVEGKNQTLRFVATDGRQMGKIDKPISILSKETDFKAIVHKNIMNIISLLCSSADGYISVRCNNIMDRLEMEADSFRISLRTIEGTFPNYNQIIPQSHDASITFNASKLLDAMKALPMPRDSYNKSAQGWDFKVRDRNLNIIVESESHEIKANGSIELEKIDGTLDSEDLQWVDFAVNPEFFMGMLGIVGDKNIRLNYEGALKPLCFIYDDSSMDNWVYILMPTRSSRTPEKAESVEDEKKDEDKTEVKEEVVNG